MKYAILIILAVWSINGLPAQIGFLDSTYVWTEVHYYRLGSQSFKYTIDSNPTFFSGKTYYGVLSTHEEQSQQWGTEAYIRFENNIIYMYSTPETELYNFNLMIGDTFSYGITSVVDSIDTIMLLTGEERKRWKLRCIYDEPGTAIFTEWVEGIGDINGLFYVNSMTECSADGDGSEIMCMYRNDTLIYDDPLLDSCWYLPTALEEPNKEIILFAPNPATDFIDIIGLEQENKYIRVFNSVGVLVYSGNEDKIDVKDFSAGFYHAVIRLNDNRTLTKGFVKF